MAPRRRAYVFRIPMHIVVAVKQVLDPEMPQSAFRVDSEAIRVLVPATSLPVVNGYDEQAVEAALLIKDAGDGVTVTVLSAGAAFAMEPLKKLVAMGADNLVLLQDAAFLSTADPTTAVRALALAIQKLEPVDLVLCGRQASDWDNAQVPLGIAETLNLPALTLARKVTVGEGRVRVERVLPNGYEVMDSPLPAVVTISNELGEPRYPTLRGIMAASRKDATIWSAAELGLDVDGVRPSLELACLWVPEREVACELISGEDGADAGRKLALRLHEANLV